jgi:hypothetical protein
VNGYYWLRNKYNDIYNRNIGYYCPLQTELAHYFKSLVIDWLNDTTNGNNIMNNMSKYLDIKKSSKDPLRDFIINLAKDVTIMTNSVIELYVLSKINRLPIVVYDDHNNVVYIFDKGLAYDSHINKK